MFDIVIPLGPEERKNIFNQIEYTKKNIVGYRNIYIVTNIYDNLEIDGCKIINESIFPFKMKSIACYFAQYNEKKNRNGWYLQQLLKLYAWVVIEELLDNYLVIDSDVFFLKPTEFIYDNKFIFTTGNEYHIPYFEHMNRLHPSFKKNYNLSGISHHMLFNKNILIDLFYLVEKKHHKPFWVVFIESVIEHTKHSVDFSESGASEYEIYFNYMIINHQDKMIIRNLNWANKPENYEITQNENEDFISICSWYK